MNFIKPKIFLFLFPIYLYGELNIKINDIVEYKINDKELVYKITAESKNLNTQNNQKNLFFINKEEIVSNKIFFINGLFEIKELKIYFKKAYFLEGNFVMIDTEGFYKKNSFISKKTIFKKEQLEFENVLIKIENKQYKKLNYIMNIEN